MFGPIGLPEALFIVVLALLIFGPRRLPELGRTVGKALGEFRRATTDLKRSINTELALEDEERPPVSRRPAATAGAPAPGSAGEVGAIPESEPGAERFAPVPYDDGASPPQAVARGEGGEGGEGVEAAAPDDDGPDRERQGAPAAETPGE